MRHIALVSTSVYLREAERSFTIQAGESVDLDEIVVPGTASAAALRLRDVVHPAHFVPDVPAPTPRPSEPEETLS